MIQNSELEALYSHRCARCGGYHPKAEGNGGLDLEKLFKRAVKMVYKDQADKVMPQLTQAFTASLGSGVAEGYGKKNPFEVKWDSPDGEMIRHLQSNVYEFSSAKSFQQLRALTDALYDKNGRIVPEREFLEVAQRINNKLGVAHLATERNTAIAGGQMASKWVMFQADKDSLPILTYITAGDGNVRPSHAAIHNVSRPVDDAFWDLYYPPNGWNCRCDVIQAVLGRKVTPLDNIQTPDDVPDMFKTNLAKTGMVFPEGHPYYQNLPEGMMEAASARNPFAYTKLPGGKKGGYVYNSAISRANSEELETAALLADKGEKVILLPHIDTDTEWQQALRKLCLPGEIPERKNVDAMINGKPVEFKYTAKATANTIDRHLRDGSKQSGTICIRVGGRISEATIKSAVKNRVMRTENIEEVWILKGAKLLKYLRADILNW